jgi:hypothetical protein
MTTMTTTTLHTANQILNFFRKHPDVRVIQIVGAYEIHRVKDGRLVGRMATYDLAQLKEWAACW